MRGGWALAGRWLVGQACLLGSIGMEGYRLGVCFSLPTQ